MLDKSTMREDLPKSNLELVFIHFIFTYLGTVAPSVHGNCFSGGRGKTFTNRKIDPTK